MYVCILCVYFSCILVYIIHVQGLVLCSTFGTDKLLRQDNTLSFNNIKNVKAISALL